MGTFIPASAAQLGSRPGRLLRLAAALTVFAASASVASAQFNGPATSSVGNEINRPVTLTSDQAVLFPVTHDQLLMPGDLVQIHLFNQPEYSPTARISLDGNVLLPLIGEVKFAGLTLSQAQVLVEHDLEQAGMYRNPQIEMTVTEGPGATATLIGEVHGSVPIVGTRRLLDVLSAVGGLPATASHVITINRPGKLEPIVVDLGSDPLHSTLANIPIFGGDTIVVARIGVVYMVGEFKTPGVINLTPYSPLTLMQATALTGGLGYDAKGSDLRIIRTVGDKRTVVKLDADAVFKGKQPDPILQPNDIVFVPSSALKVLIQQGGLGALFGAISVGVTGIALARQ